MDVVIRCNDCDYTTDNKANLYKHRLCHRSMKTHRCSRCLYECRTASNLKRHEATHTDTRQYQCAVCQRTFPQKTHVQTHLRRCHFNGNNVCGLCERGFSTKRSLDSHVISEHGGRPSDTPETNSSGERIYPVKAQVFECRECGATFDDKKSLQQHEKRHVPGMKVYCDKCSYVSDSASKLERHARTHTQLKPFSCGFCDYRSNQKEHVARHTRAKHKHKLLENSVNHNDTHLTAGNSKEQPRNKDYEGIVIGNSMDHSNALDHCEADTLSNDSHTSTVMAHSETLHDNTVSFPPVFEDIHVGIVETAEVTIGDIPAESQVFEFQLLSNFSRFVDSEVEEMQQFVDFTNAETVVTVMSSPHTEARTDSVPTSITMSLPKL